MMRRISAIRINNCIAITRKLSAPNGGYVKVRNYFCRKVIQTVVTKTDNTLGNMMILLYNSDLEEILFFAIYQGSFTVKGGERK